MLGENKRKLRHKTLNCPPVPVDLMPPRCANPIIPRVTRHLVNVLEPSSPSGSAVRMNLTGPSTSILASEITSVGSFCPCSVLLFGANGRIGTFIVNGVPYEVYQNPLRRRKHPGSLFLKPENDSLENSSDGIIFDIDQRMSSKTPDPPSRQAKLITLHG